MKPKKFVRARLCPAPQDKTKGKDSKNPCSPTMDELDDFFFGFLCANPFPLNILVENV
jgi:hypothetical protein